MLMNEETLRALDPEAVELGRPCVKCASPGILSAVDPKKAVYCKECFVQMVKHKFRSTLGKRRIYKDGAPKETLLIFDGSPSSALALGQLLESAIEGIHRKLMIVPTVLFVISSLDSTVITKLESDFNSFSSQLSFPSIVVHLAAVLEKDFCLEEKKETIGLSRIPELSEYLNSFASSSCRMETVRLLKEILSAKIAKMLNIDKVMFCDNGDTLAQLTLTAFCLGRGGDSSDLTSVAERRLGVSFIRPLHDICTKEVSLLNRLEGYDKYELTDNLESLEPKSIQLTTDQFVNTLLTEGFRATTSTVLSTSAKIHRIVSSSHKCSFCGTHSREAGLCVSCEELKSDSTRGQLFDMVSSD